MRNDDADAERDPADTVVCERWTHAVAAVREHLIQLEAARSEAERQRQVRDEVYASKVALCERLAALVAEDGNEVERTTVEVAAIRAAWDATAEAPAEDDAGSAERSSAVIRRFQELLAATERQAVTRATTVERVAKLGALATALEQLSEAKDLGELKGGWQSAHREWTTLSGESTPSELSELRPRVEAAEARRAERLQIVREERTRRERANLAKQEGRCEEIEQALADEGLELKTAEHWMRLTRSLLGNLGRLPSSEDRERITARLRAAQTGLTGRVRELRGLAEWKQWANVGIQAALCQRLETAAAHPDSEAGDAAVAKEVRQIMDEWRQAADVPRGEGDEIWKRFKTAHDAVRPRLEAHQAKQDLLQQEHLQKKIALCDEVEQLADSTDWMKTAERITELQQQWKKIGSAGRKHEREVWNRFRAASGRFFKRRRDDLVERKQVWAKNAALKEELCAKAEALSEEQDFDKAKGVVRQLQIEWKQIGPVRRSRSEALWQRFRTGCDDVYRRAQAVVDASFVEQITARAAACERLEALVPQVTPAESTEAEGIGESGGSDTPARVASSGEAAASVETSESVQTTDSVESFIPSEPGSDTTPVAEPTAPVDLAETVKTAREEWRQLPPVPRPQERSLTARFETAIIRVVECFPEAFAGTDLDPARNVAILERLCERVESFVKDEAGVATDDRTPAEILAMQLKEALASNTMGAGVDPEAKRLEMIEKVKQLQAERRALGRVPGETGQQLSDRFRAACDRFFARNPVPPTRAARPRGDGSQRRRRSGRAPVSH
ncbi:MAG: DUF349 domain-containing protein [Acidobacteriota bacterium]|nr:DUF349 domain-containing protein [Acidobacteriota bacterium]